MLIISRKKGQRIFVNGEEITITVLDARKDLVELGFDAPEHIIINREERLRQQQLNSQFTQHHLTKSKEK